MAGRCVTSVCRGLSVLRATGLIRRVGKRGWWDKGTGTWCRLADTYEVTQAGWDVLKRGAPQQADAMARVVEAAPRKRGCPPATWLSNLVLRAAVRRETARQHDALPASVRGVLARAPVACPAPMPVKAPHPVMPDAAPSPAAPREVVQAHQLGTRAPWSDSWAAGAAAARKLAGL